MTTLSASRLGTWAAAASTLCALAYTLAQLAEWV
jgi:hypothetical protein